MSYRYPIDVDQLAQRIQKRGDAVQRHFALAQAGEREDQKLRQIVRRGGKGWFPVMADRSFHGAVDLGLVAVEGDTLQGTPVHAIAEGEVLFCDTSQRTEHDYDVGRVVVRHTSPDGKEVFVLYQHLGEVHVRPAQKISAGEELGSIGWHGDYPHVHVAVASPHALGDDVLGTQATKEKLPEGDAVWSVRRVQVAQLDEAEWPQMPSADTWYLYDPIEFVRFCRGEAPIADVGAPALALESAPHAEASAAHVARPNVHEVPELLRSAELKGCADLQQLAADPDFAPVGAGAAKQLVEAVQQALVALGFQLPEATRGTWCDATKAAVERFEKDAVQPADWSWLGRSKDDVKVDGSLDWLTLLALDSALVEKAQAKKTPAKPADPPKPPPRPEAQPKPVASGKKSGILFDASEEKDENLSLAFGLRMYEFLLKWNEQKCGYSTADNVQYTPPAAGVVEWPLMDGILDDDLADKQKLTVDDTPRTTYALWGAHWVSSNFANCSISQMAAFTAAVRGRPFQIRARFDDMEQHQGELFDWTFDPKGGNPTVRLGEFRDVVKKDANGKKVKLAKGEKPERELAKVVKTDRATVFEKLMMSLQPQDESGRNLYDAAVFGLPCALRYMKVGRVVTAATTDQQALLKARISDLAATVGHAWMVGDVRYQVTFEPDAAGKKPLTRWVDQSCFIEHDEAQLFASTAGKHPAMDERLRKLLLDDEATFERRVQAFLALPAQGGTLTVDGKARKVAEIKVGFWKVFSANCVYTGTKRTSRNQVFLKNKAGEWEYNDDATTTNAGGIGVCGAWKTYAGEPIALGRFYKLGTPTL